jgi:hypothetical protein
MRMIVDKTGSDCLTEDMAFQNTTRLSQAGLVESRFSTAP